MRDRREGGPATRSWQDPGGDAVGKKAASADTGGDRLPAHAVHDRADEPHAPGRSGLRPLQGGRPAGGEATTESSQGSG